MDKPLLKITDLMKLFGRGRTTIFEWTRNGYLPKPIMINGRTVGWNQEDINRVMRGEHNA